MDAKLYLNKAIMQLSRGLEEGGVQSLKAALEGEGDEVSKTQARVILGEYFVMKGEPAQAKEYLGPVAQDIPWPVRARPSSLSIRLRLRELASC